MKLFIINNWYKMILAFSALIFSCAFMIYAVKNNTARAGDFKAKGSFTNNPPSEVYIVAIDKRIYEVSWNSSLSEYQTKLVATVR